MNLLQQELNERLKRKLSLGLPEDRLYEPNESKADADYVDSQAGGQFTVNAKENSTPAKGYQFADSSRFNPRPEGIDSDPRLTGGMHIPENTQFSDLDLQQQNPEREELYKSLEMKYRKPDGIPTASQTAAQSQEQAPAPNAPAQGQTDAEITAQKLKDGEDLWTLGKEMKPTPPGSSYDGKTQREGNKDDLELRIQSVIAKMDANKVPLDAMANYGGGWANYQQNQDMFAKNMLRSAAQAGSLGGKMADTKATDDYYDKHATEQQAHADTMEKARFNERSLLQKELEGLLNAKYMQELTKASDKPESYPSGTFVPKDKAAGLVQLQGAEKMNVPGGNYLAPKFAGEATQVGKDYKQGPMVMVDNKLRPTMIDPSDGTLKVINEAEIPQKVLKGEPIMTGEGKDRKPVETTRGEYSGKADVYGDMVPPEFKTRAPGAGQGESWTPTGRTGPNGEIEVRGLKSNTTKLLPIQPGVAKPLDDKDMKDLQQVSSIMKSMKEIKDNYDPRFVGPAAGRLLGAGDGIGANIYFSGDDLVKYNKFMAGMESLRGVNRRELTGLAASIPEMRMINKTIMSPTIDPKSFKAMLDDFEVKKSSGRKALENAYKNAGHSVERDIAPFFNGLDSPSLPTDTGKVKVRRKSDGVIKSVNKSQIKAFIGNPAYEVME